MKLICKNRTLFELLSWMQINNSRLCDPARPFTAYSTLLTHYRWPFYLVLWPFLSFLAFLSWPFYLGQSWPCSLQLHQKDIKECLIQEPCRASTIWMFSLWRHIHSTAQSELPPDDPRKSNQVMKSSFWKTSQELRMLSPSLCIQRSQYNCSYSCSQLSEM